MLKGGTNKVGGLPWVVGAVHRILQGCYGDYGIVLPIPELELELELEVSGWWTGLFRIAVAKAAQSIVAKRKERQQQARLLYEGWVALEFCPETPGGGMTELDTRV